MHKKTVKNKLLIISIIISSFIAVLIILLSTILYKKATRLIGLEIYKAYFSAYKYDIQSTLKLDIDKSYQLKRFVEDRISGNELISASDLENIIRLSNTKDANFYGLGLMLLPGVKVDTSGGYSDFYNNKMGFSIGLVNSYLGITKVNSFEKLSQYSEAWAINKVLNSGLPLVLNPYEITKFDDIKIFTSILIPIVKERKTLGLVKLDFNLSDLDLNKFANASEFSEVRLISNNGKIAASSRNYFVGRSITELEKSYHSHLLDIQSGATNEFLERNDITIQMPIEFLFYDKYWQIEAVIESPAFYTFFKTNITILSVLIILLIFIIQLIFYYFIKKELKPINDLVEIGNKLGKGDVDIKEVKFSQNEFLSIYNSFLKVVDNFKYLTNTVVEIGKGNLNYSYKLRSDKDVIGKAIIEMESRLKIANDEEQKLKLESQNRGWISGGLAEFGMLLKNTNVSSKELFNLFISRLVEYIDAVQGTLFQLYRKSDDEEKWYLDLLSAYAYHQNKYLEKRVMHGEGLVGMCAKEQASVIIKDVPANYIFIKSAFGGTVPKNIVLVPLIFNEIVYGVLEIATLADFDDYKVEFLEQLSENIANTLAISESSEKTNLLLEQTQKQSHELLAREEELRHNIEEIETTKERYQSNVAQMKSYTNALNENQMVVEFRPNGNLSYFNSNFKDFLRLSDGEIRSLNLMSLLSIEESLHKKMMFNMNNNELFEFKHFILVGGERKYFKAVFSPVFNEKSGLVKIIGIGYDSTELNKLKNASEK